MKRTSDPARSGPSWPFREAGRYVEAGSVRWHLVRFGSGPPLLLLHGTASSAHAWAEVASRVESGFSVVIPDLPGHGYSSSMPSGASGPDHLARALADLLLAEGVSPLLVAGHSVGAVLAIRAAHRGWIAPRGILGVNPALGPRSRYLPPLLEGPLTAFACAGLTARAGAALIRALPVAEAFLDSTGSRVSPEVQARYRALLSDPARVRGVLHLQAGWDPTEAGREAGQLSAVVRYLTGAEDRWVPPSVVRDEAFGRSIVELPDRGHLLPEEDPAAVADAIWKLAREVMPPTPGEPSPPEPEPH